MEEFPEAVPWIYMRGEREGWGQEEGGWENGKLEEMGKWLWWCEGGFGEGEVHARV